MKYYILEGSFVENHPVGPAFQEALKGHHQYLSGFFADGTILLSGPKPGGGGVILLKAPDDAWVEKFCQEDPFVTAGVQSYRVIEYKMFDAQESVKGWFAD